MRGFIGQVMSRLVGAFAIVDHDLDDHQTVTLGAGAQAEALQGGRPHSGHQHVGASEPTLQNGPIH